MRHRKQGKKLNMKNAHRKAVIRNMLTSLIEHEQIQTTAVRCKLLKREMDKLVTLGKKGTLHARRTAAGRLFTPESVQKLFNELAPRYEGRHGGYTRVYRLGQRRGDGAHVGIIQLLRADEGMNVETPEATEE
jgi:large subunit ribosomal protein L17